MKRERSNKSLRGSVRQQHTIPTSGNFRFHGEDVSPAMNRHPRTPDPGLGQCCVADSPINSRTRQFSLHYKQHIRSGEYFFTLTPGDSCFPITKSKRGHFRQAIITNNVHSKRNDNRSGPELLVLALCFLKYE